jgi:AraC-like DNA-binding protein
VGSVSHASQWEFAIEGDLAHLRVRQAMERPGAEALVAMMSDFGLAVSVRRMRDVLGDEAVQVSSVCFSREAPPSTKAHERFFRAPVKFGTNTGVDEVVVPVALFAAPLLTADPMLAEALRARASGGQEKRGDQPAEPFLDRIRSVIQASLSEGETGLGIDVIAAQLDMSARALQRKLKERSLFVSGLIDESRRNVAESLLARESALLCDVAYQLGFRDVEAFFRAFRRWTGTSPRAFQRAKATSE